MATAKLNPVSQNPVSAKSRWQPLLTGNLHREALTTVREIASALSLVLPPAGNGAEKFPEIYPATLTRWKAEIALFHAYLAVADKNPENAHLAYEYLNEAIRETAEHAPSAGLFGGVTEIGWIVAHLTEFLLGEEDKESCAVVDEFLNEHLAQAEWHGDYDLISGLAGFGVYALERAQQDTQALEIMRKVISQLRQTAEHNEHGITWHTGPALLPEWQLQSCPQGHYNLGAAHGVPGVIAMLAQACAMDEIGFPARVLLDGAVNWLLANKSYDEQGPYLTYWIAPGVKPGLARQAWCYGELGAATALLLAARCTESQDWEKEALTLLQRSALRQLGDSGVTDSGLCHGAAGNAHLFNRIYQATGAPLFQQAALYWYERIFDFHMPGKGIAGYLSSRESEGKIGWDTNAGFLDGATGVGLALLAAATDIEPNWDRLLLASIPPCHNQINA